MRQHGTIERPADLEGRGFILDRPTKLRLLPAQPRTGFRFVRTDLEGQPSVTASVRNLHPAANCTMLEDGRAKVMVIEHLLAACWGTGVTDLVIETDGPEIPTLDGSARPFAEKLRGSGIVASGTPVPGIVLRQPIAVNEEGGKLLIAYPADGFRLSYVLHYPERPEVQTDFLAVEGTPEELLSAVLPARTFIPEEEALRLLEEGLIRSTDETMGVVVRPGQTPQLRMPHEFARHKILDLLGDLAILGRHFQAHFLGVMSGHHLNARMVRALAARYP